MDHNFTERLKKWLETEAQSRDYAEGALMLLQLSGNRVMYNNIVANPGARAEFIEYQLQKYYNFRVQDLTHEQVNDMERQVKSIVKENIPLAAEADAVAKGKRPDHDSLPDEVKACYVENLSLLRRMRELHLRLRTLSLTDTPCPDSERYPFLKEMIALDKKLHANWETYDRYNAAITSPAPKRSRKKTCS